MNEIGIDISKHFIKPVTEEMVNRADIIYVFCEPDKLPAYLANSQKIIHVPIADPHIEGETNANARKNNCRETRNSIKELIKLGIIQ